MQMTRLSIRSVLLLLIACGGQGAVCQPRHTSQRYYTQRIPGTGVTFEMVSIPAGAFLMGSPATEPGRKDDEGPRHPVKVDSLWVGTVEVTWDLFDLFLNENKSLFADLPAATRKGVDAVSRPTPPFEDPGKGMGRKGFPVVNVSPYGALTFCKWLSILTGRFYRLPTEAEWEYICRAGSETTYGFGNDPAGLGEYAVYFGNSNGQYAKGASRKPNAWGVYDLHGNVAEWTLDEYDAGFYAQSKDTLQSPWKVPTSLYSRVYRGGSWDDHPAELRSAARKRSGPALQKDDPQIPKSFWWYTNASFIGFRLVSPARQPSGQEQKNFWAVVLDE